MDDCFLKLRYLYVIVCNMYIYMYIYNLCIYIYLCTHTFAHNKFWNMYHLKMRDFNCHVSSPGGIKYIYCIYDTITEH